MICKNFLDRKRICGNGCCKHTTDKFIKVCENNREYLVHNDKRRDVLVVKVDGGAIKGNEALRCDYIFVFENEGRFIELKGKNVSHAVDQITRTIEQYGKMFTNCSARIVCKCVTASIKLSANFIKLKGMVKGNLVVRERIEDNC